MLIIEEKVEALALIKLLNFIKFDCLDGDCLFYASSPIINSIYDKVSSEVIKQYPYDYKDREYIEESSMHLQSLKSNIERTENWIDLKLEIKEKYICELIHPFKIKQETLNELVKYGNQFQKKV